MTRALLTSAIAMLLLAGCSMFPAREPVAVPAVYAVPVAEMCPVPVLPEKQPLAIADITPSTPDAAVITAYAESLNTCISRAAALEILLNGYQK